MDLLMRRRRKPRPLPEILLRAGITVVGLAILYATTIHMLERITKQNTQHAQQLEPKPLMPGSTMRPSTPAPSEADIQRQREMAEAMAAQRAAEQRKQEAWERFYQPPRACTYPESSRRVAVCQANEQKQREAFELTWAPQVQQ